MSLYLASGIVYNVSSKGTSVDTMYFRDVIEKPLSCEEAIRDYENSLARKHGYYQALVLNFRRLPDEE